MPLKHKVTVKTYLTPAERAKLYDDAARRGVSASKYIRLILNHHVQAQMQPPVKSKIRDQ